MRSFSVFASILLGILPGCSRPPEEIFRTTVEMTIDGNDPGAIFTPAGLCVDDSGRVLVLDRYMGQVDIFNPDGSFVASFGGWGEGPGRLSWLFFNFCVDDAGNVYLIDERRIIEVFDRNGSFARSMDPDEPPGFWQIFDIAVSDSIIVLNCTSPLAEDSWNAITVTGTDGRILRRFGGTASDLDGMPPALVDFYRSCTIDIDDEGSIYYTSIMDYAVCKYTAEGALVFGSVPESSPEPVVDIPDPDEFRGVSLVRPAVWDLCVAGGMVFVVRGEPDEARGSRVDVFSAETGEFLGFLYTGVPAGGMPYCIRVSGGSLYTADADGAIVYKLALGRL
ncbi:MAG: 6-bladed beta-propeller [Candidatus Fermentibacter sp.]|nr:6-bladed beta-propeller [Candidatus Fermentibacter sp.]